MNAKEALLSHLRQREANSQNIHAHTHPQMLTQAHNQTTPSYTNTHTQMSHPLTQTQQQSYTPAQLFGRIQSPHTSLNNPHLNNAHTNPQAIHSRATRNRYGATDQQIEWQAMIGSLWSEMNKQPMSDPSRSQRSGSHTNAQDYSGETHRSTAAMSDPQINGGHYQTIVRANVNSSSHTGSVLTDLAHESSEHATKSQPQQWTTTGGTFSPITGILSADGFYIRVVSPKPKIDDVRDNIESIYTSKALPAVTVSGVQSQRAKHTNTETALPTRIQVNNPEETRNPNLENNQKVANSEKKNRRKGQTRKEDQIEGRVHPNEGNNAMESQEGPTHSRNHAHAYTHSTGSPHAQTVATVPRFDLNPNAPEFVPQWNKPKSTTKGKKHPPSHAHTHNHASRAAPEGKDMNARKNGEFDVWAREMAL